MKKLFTVLAFVSLGASAQLSQLEFNRQFNTTNPYAYNDYLNKYNQAKQSQTSHYQEGYYRSDGTYVQSHYKTNSNNTNWDNYSTQGNTNPYTLQPGYVAPDYSQRANSYGQGQTIYTGSRGGQYYINRNGNKVYIPKRSGY